MSENQVSVQNFWYKWLYLYDGSLRWRSSILFRQKSVENNLFLFVGNKESEAAIKEVEVGEDWWLCFSLSHLFAKHSLPSFKILQLTLFNSGGGQICPHHHIFASKCVCMRIHMLIFCDFSSFWVWKRVQQFWPQKKSPFSQELKKLVDFAQLS